MKAYALIVAGGTGTRFGADRPKQYLPLGDGEVLSFSYAAFSACEEISGIVIVAQDIWHNHVRALCDKCGSEKLLCIAQAGDDRRASVRNGLHIFEQLGLGKDSVVLVHDAARPFLTKEVIMENIASASEFGACCTVVPATDTPIVSADGKTIDQMPPRSTMYMSQTPQSFSMELLIRAHDTVPTDAPDVTDDCSLVRAIGHSVRLVMGTQQLFKITRAQDMIMAQNILEDYYG
ncbi:MAG: 2-C-methyl-D-erythritol 4-phosphate cytidylyltransferase [Clostridia bacterium]|nr:2-C-methyl-D-erythritol 4-phosphate cytidylyltransferase [Clostridia bacterium]